MLTVVIATHNGGETLQETLTSLETLSYPLGGWKLVIVDNASDDETPNILQHFKSRLPLTVLQQERRGKNISLNTAVPHFEGDLIVFSDDDIIADTEWLVRLRQAADEHPDFDIFGGRILPHWKVEPPSWLWEAIPVPIVYAVTGKTVTQGPVDPGRVWGPNMAIRRKIFDDGHRFDESVGPSIGQYRMGSETEFTVRLSHLGYKSWHASNSVVYHIVQGKQFEQKWIISRAFRFGKDMYWKENDPTLVGHVYLRKKNTPYIFGFPRYYFGLLLTSGPKALIARIRKRRVEEMRARWELAFWRGYFNEAIKRYNARS